MMPKVFSTPTLFTRPAPRGPAGDAQIYAEQVRHLFHMSRASYPGTAINASIMTLALWDVVDNVVLGRWFVATLVITLARYLLYRAYRAAPAADADAPAWANRFLAGAAAMGCMWGVLGTALFPSGSIPHQFLVIFVIGGVVMASAVALAPVHRVFYGFMFPALAPLIVLLFSKNDKLQFTMGVLGTVFAAVILAFAVSIKESFLASIRIKFENAELVARLSAANQQVQQSNERLQEKVESQQRAEEALRQASQKFQALINASPLAIVVSDAEGLIERWNPAAERIFGWSEVEVLGRRVPWYPSGTELEEGTRYRNMILRGDAFSDTEAVLRRKDWLLIPVSISGAPIYDHHGSSAGVLVIVADITERRRVAWRQELQAEITRVLAESHAVEEAILKVIQTMCGKLDWVCGARWVFDRRDDVLRCEQAWGTDSPAVQEFVVATRGKVTQKLNYEDSSAAGVVRRVWDSAEPVWSSNVLADPHFQRAAAASKAGLHTALGFPVLIGEEFYGVMEFYAQDAWPADHGLIELTRQLGSQIGQFLARKQAEDNLRFVATHDALTLLPNRMMFTDRAVQALAQAQRYNRRLAILFIDLDGFKAINDNFGHSAGDVLLKEVAGRLRINLRVGDVIGRFGGDEFVVLVEELGDPGEVIGMARKIIETVAQPVMVYGRACAVTASIGISTYPEDGRDSQMLLKNADAAMYRAKEQGKNRFQFYSGGKSGAA
jgi:diguanylate cyclase (GGDEF)-like protein/PAS domain S-box-containing protein